ncbi:hypothetical protein FQ085_06465 [Planococcus sp. ANT_H30]|uniref:hypothetical protein n=1 Tax=Planococcus TaxID=1372 RepID=UPI0011EBB6B9|nr:MULTISPECIES: hypothetical protein [Planococcus]KAA0957689.1 hypothetical protein FQ085_06465 [Planococcus sp. ANT_H30]MCH4825793.1 hypothetical protein [Planococcus halocryophilus]
MAKEKEVDELKEMLSKPKVNIEDSHARTTFLLDRELADRLNKLADGKRGFKSLFFNRAVKNLLDELEDK